MAYIALKHNELGAKGYNNSKHSQKIGKKHSTTLEKKKMNDMESGRSKPERKKTKYNLMLGNISDLSTTTRTQDVFGFILSNTYTTNPNGKNYI